MGMKDDLLKARASELKSAINKLRLDVANGQIDMAQQASDQRLLRETLEAVGVLQEEMENVRERLDRLEKQIGQ